MDKEEARQLIDEILEDVALVLGGSIAVHRIANEVIWALVRSLEVIRENAHRRLGKRNGGQPSAQQLDINPHPAIKAFLLSLRRT